MKLRHFLIELHSYSFFLGLYEPGGIFAHLVLECKLMLSISHSLTGAFIATKLPHPLLYIPLIFASHYLEDWIPHWDVGTGLGNGSRKRHHAIMMEFVELGIMAVMVYFYWQHGSTELNFHAWIGASVGLIPDFMEAPRNFLKWEPAWLKPWNDLHGQFHHSTPNMLLGLTPQLGLWLLIWVLR